MKIHPQFDCMTDAQKNWVFWYGIKAFVLGLVSSFAILFNYLFK